MINNNNRPSLAYQLAAISATGEYLLLHCHKKMRIKAASYLQDGAISASGVNYLAMQLLVDEVAVGSVVDTQLGLADRAVLALGLGDDGYVDVEAGSVISLQVTETGTFAEGAAALLSLDLEVIGS